MSPQGCLVWAEVWVHYLKVTQSCPTLLRPHGLQPSSFLCPWNSAGQSTGVGSHSLLHGIFPTQGLNPGLPNCKRYLRLASFHQAESPSHPHPGTVPWGQWDQYYQPFALIEGCGTKLLSFYFKRNQTNFLKKRKRWANSSKCNMKAQLHSATSAQYLPEWVFLEEPRRILD